MTAQPPDVTRIPQRIDCATNGHCTPRLMCGVWFGTDPDLCMCCGERVENTNPKEH